MGSHPAMIKGKVNHCSHCTSWHVLSLYNLQQCLMQTDGPHEEIAASAATSSSRLDFPYLKVPPSEQMFFSCMIFSYAKNA